MKSIVFVNIIIVSVTFGLSSGSCPTMYGYEIPAFDNKKISQSVMWTMNNLTKAKCLAECHKEKYCLSVHFSPLEPNCVALRERFDDVSVATTETSGYQLFQMKKPVSEPGSDCEVDVDCVSLSKSHCHVGICRCDIGYGLNGTLCRQLTECADFGDSFTMFSGHVIANHDMQTDSGVTREVCQQNCLANPNCESADYDSDVSICFLQQKTWFDVTEGEQVSNSPTYDFYQRECNTWE